MRRSSPTLTSGIHWRHVAWHHSPGSVVGFRAPPSIGHRQHWGGLLSSCTHRSCEQGHFMENAHDPRHALHDCLLCPCAGLSVGGSYSSHVTVLRNAAQTTRTCQMCALRQYLCEPSTMCRLAIVRYASQQRELMQWDEFLSGCYLELTGSAEPHVILARQLLHPIARLVHCDATHITAHQLILVIVHIAVTHCASVTCPPHLYTPMTSHQALQLHTCWTLAVRL